MQGIRATKIQEIIDCEGISKKRYIITEREQLKRNKYD